MMSKRHATPRALERAITDRTKAQAASEAEVRQLDGRDARDYISRRVNQLRRLQLWLDPSRPSLPEVPPPLGIDQLGSFSVRALAVEVQIADEVCAMHEVRGTMPSSRWRDLADIATSPISRCSRSRLIGSMRSVSSTKWSPRRRAARIPWHGDCHASSSCQASSSRAGPPGGEAGEGLSPSPWTMPTKLLGRCSTP